MVLKTRVRSPPPPPFYRMNRGALYIATKLEDSNPHAKRGDMLKMALHSIDSLKKVSNLPITLFTNMLCDRTDINVVQIESLNTERDYSKDKIFYMQQTPYESTIFLDVDTEVLEDPEPLFDAHYDFCMPYAPKCDWEKKVWYGYGYSYSTGTFLYNKNQITDLIFKRSKERYRQMEMDPDANIENKKNWLCDQTALDRTIKQGITSLGAIVKPLHPRWLGIPPVVQFVDNVATFHAKNLHKWRKWLVERRTQWTMENDTLLDDLLLWDKQHKIHK